jgi:hypothetical protein
VGIVQEPLTGFEAVFAATRLVGSGTPMRPGWCLESRHTARAMAFDPEALCRGCECGYQTRPGSRAVTSWTIHVLSSGSLKEKKDP